MARAGVRIRIGPRLDVSPQPKPAQRQSACTGLQRHEPKAALQGSVNGVHHPDAVLNAIRTNAGLAAMDIADAASSPPVAPLLQELDASAQRATSLYAQIRGFRN